MKYLRTLLKEAKKSNTAVLTYGRMNPPTIGHVKLSQKIQLESKTRVADPFIFLSPTQNAKKDPLNSNRKLYYAKKVLGKNITIEVKPNIFVALSDLYSKGYENAIIVVGSDRIPEFSKVVPKYNGVEGKAHGFYNFENIEFVSSGDRDPDAEGVEGMSASKLRGFATSGDFDDFKQGTGLSDKDAKSLYNEIRKAMKVESVIYDIRTDDLSETKRSGKYYTDSGAIKKSQDDSRVPGHQPKKYGAGLSKSEAERRYSHFEKNKEKSDSDPDAYKPAPGDDKPAPKQSKYTKKYKQMYGEEFISEAEIAGLKKKAEKSGVSYGILKKVWDRGIAAWKGGHRPGTTPQQWAYARVNSFLTGGKTRTTADADLWAKTKRTKSESVGIDSTFEEWLFLSEVDSVVSTPVGVKIVRDKNPIKAKIEISKKFKDKSDRDAVKSKLATHKQKKYISSTDDDNTEFNIK
jgi:hypothetical protein